MRQGGRSICRRGTPRDICAPSQHNEKKRPNPSKKLAEDTPGELRKQVQKLSFLYVKAVWYRFVYSMGRILPSRNALGR
jgi:hypothetical protein